MVPLATVLLHCTLPLQVDQHVFKQLLARELPQVGVWQLRGKGVCLMQSCGMFAFGLGKADLYECRYHMGMLVSTQPPIGLLWCTTHTWYSHHVYLAV
jgi:hypothetical protein